MDWTTGCFGIVRNNKHQILLVKRRDYPLWDLPGGRLDAGETHEECVIREVREETGYLIQVEDVVANCLRPSFHDTQIIYTASVAGGIALPFTEETTALRWVTRVPWYMPMIPNRRFQIRLYQKKKSHMTCTLKDRHPLLLIQKLIIKR